jgi:hypothetical protein
MNLAFPRVPIHAYERRFRLLIILDQNMDGNAELQLLTAV